MIKINKLQLVWLTLALMVAGSGAALAVDIPLAVVDSQRITQEYEAARDAQEQYQKFLRDLELEVADKEKELSLMMEELESQKLLLGEAALAAKFQEFEEKKAAYFQFRESIDQRAEAEFVDRIQPILDQVKTIVERLGKEKKIGLVVDSASMAVLFLDADFDLTNDVLAALARGDD